MSFIASPNALNRLLRVCYRRPHINCLFRQTFTAGIATAQAQEGVNDVAVLGAGISGLSTAYFLAKEFPKANITVIDSSPRIGGWIQSTPVDVEKFMFNGKRIDGGKVVFEQGPRTLRTQGTAATAALYTMCDLDIDKDALLTHRNAPAAQNRYIYYPDHLVRMPNPGSIMSYNGWTEPIFEGLGKGMLMELFRPRRLNVADESISSFISRRFSPKLADNIVSAVIHGIYAGDIDKLSIRALMPNLWNLELAERSLLKGVAKTVFQGNVLTNARDVFNVINLKDYAPSDPKRLHDIRKASVFTLKEGLETLATAFKAATEKASANVKYDLNTTIESLTLASGDGARSDSRDITLHTRTTDSSGSSHPTRSVRTFSHIISTLSAPALAKLLPISVVGILPKVNYATVQVVNLFYADPKLLPVSGFGYLIPRSVNFDQNPEFALGVIFDSETSSALDTVQGTKLTVMLGGHWWDGWTDYPSPEDGIQMARNLLERHLNIKAEPLVARATLQKDCIPQYEVGHVDRVLSYAKKLGSFKGRLKVTGNWISGVGVNDSILASFELVKEWDMSRTRGSELDEAFIGPEHVWKGMENVRVVKRA